MDRIDELEKPNRKDIKEFYFDFLKDFREYLAEYMRDTVYELKIAEIPVTPNSPTRIFSGIERGKVTIKNQGEISCFVGTSAMGGYRLDPNEKIEFFVNKEVVLTTLSGSTTVGFIKS